MPDLYHTRLQNIKAILQLSGTEVFILSVSDEFFSEYPPDHFKRLQWLTGFDGSAGTVVIAPQKSAFFTDGRYTLQASQQVNSQDYDLFNSSETSPLNWLEKHYPTAKIGVDPWLFSAAHYDKWKAKLFSAQWEFLTPNPIDRLWQDRPPLSSQSGFDYPVTYAGKSREEKLAQIAAAIVKAGADAVLLTLPESICWLLNLRGHDVTHTPLLLCRALIHADGTYDLFADPAKVPAPLHAAACTVEEACAALEGKKILIDSAQTPLALVKLLQNSNAILIEGEDPCTLPKARKNEIEAENIRNTHIKDGVALTRFLHWLYTTDAHLDEISVANKLELFRREDSDFIEPSFPTISGFGDHGAIVHYRAAENHNRKFSGNTLYLVDSGGQYWGGTTDVTRTLAYGQPSLEMREHYTRVLKGHIALAQIVFPKGTTGRQLDVLARQFLWQAGLDYDHGTGHGVGCFLGVHEGPQRIGKQGSDTALQPGMILSNEPGYYKTGAYGIRIENLVMVKESSHPDFLEFATLTCAPFDKNLVDIPLLTQTEISWWNQYHAWIEAQLSPLLPAECQEWLKSACSPLRL